MLPLGNGNYVNDYCISGMLLRELMDCDDAVEESWFAPTRMIFSAKFGGRRRGGWMMIWQ